MALLVDPSPRGDGGTLFVQSATVPQPLRLPAVAAGTRQSHPQPPRARIARTAAHGPSGAALPRRVSPWDKDAPKIVPADRRRPPNTITAWCG